MNLGPVEVSSTEVTTTILPSRKDSVGSTYNSGEDIATILAVSEVDERSDLGMLASPLLTQVTLSYQHGATRRGVFKQEELKSRPQCCVGACFRKRRISF